jgi:hypothetical protein
LWRILDLPQGRVQGKHHDFLKEQNFMTFPILTPRMSITSLNPSQRFYPCFSLKELVNYVVLGGNLGFLRISFAKETHKGRAKK